jgi:hypothetical protein
MFDILLQHSLLRNNLFDNLALWRRVLRWYLSGVSDAGRDERNQDLYTTEPEGSIVFTIGRPTSCNENVLSGANHADMRELDRTDFCNDCARGSANSCDL